MGLAASNVGRHWGPVDGRLDSRWTMAYAAGAGDDSACYYDTLAQPHAVHPVYPVSPEWSLLITDVAADEPWSLTDARQGVHATHDLVLHRTLQVGMAFSLTATVVSLEQRSPGAYQVVRFEARDAEGRALWTSWMGTIFRGVGIEGRPTTIDAPVLVTAPSEGPLSSCSHFAVTVTDAHIYSECARIWNPIHTDASIARQAGLDGPILHGTAILAKAVSHLSKRWDIKPPDVGRIACRFASPARPGDVLTVRTGEPHTIGTETGVAFEVANSYGHTVLRDGLLGVRRSPHPAGRSRG